VVEKLALLFGKDCSSVPSIKVPDSSVHREWGHGIRLGSWTGNMTVLDGKENLRDCSWANGRFPKKHPRSQSTWRHPHELVLIVYLQSLNWVITAVDTAISPAISAKNPFPRRESIIPSTIAIVTRNDQR
jgi:hypothetical protein